MSSESREMNGMEGDLETFPVLDMFVWLHQGAQTALMRVDAGGAPGWAFFQRGQLFRCEWRGLKGREAVFALTQAQNGRFWLSKRLLRAGHANVDTPTSELLLECAMVIDGHRPAA